MTHHTDAELLPCPFCGENCEERSEKGWYACSNIDCPAFHLQSLQEEWNRRAPAAPAQPMPAVTAPGKCYAQKFAVGPEPLTDAQIASACLSYRHDFGLMTNDERKRLIFQAREWERALNKARGAA